MSCLAKFYQQVATFQKDSQMLQLPSSFMFGNICLLTWIITAWIWCSWSYFLSIRTWETTHYVVFPFFLALNAAAVGCFFTFYGICFFCLGTWRILCMFSETSVWSRSISDIFSSSDTVWLWSSVCFLNSSLSLLSLYYLVSLFKQLFYLHH